MDLEFWKLHGLGNDYLYFDIREGMPPTADWPRLAKSICDRHFGVGADGIITIGRSDVGDAKMRIYNADGSLSEMCGNGLRAMAKWLYDRGFAGSRQAIETDAGVLYPEVIETSGKEAVRIRVNMGAPRFEAAQCGWAAGADRHVLQEEIVAGGERFLMALASMGNPHLIVFGELWDVDTMARLGPALEHHPWFPARINVHSAEVLGEHEFAMRHWERGAGLTLACGTGVAAATAAAVRLGFVTSPVTVHVPGGALEAEWTGDPKDAVFLTGPAEEVFHGYYPWTEPR